MNINQNFGFSYVTTFSVSSDFLSAFDVDWGDGNYSESWPHFHSYNSSGEYTVRILGCSALSSIQYIETVCVEDYVKPTLEIIQDPLFSYVGQGEIFQLGVSSLTPNITLHFYSSGSESVPYSEPSGFWDHLNPRWRFLDINNNVISMITLSGTPMTYEADNKTHTVGYSAGYTFKYIDDMPNTPILFVTLETNHSNSRVYSGIPHEVVPIIPNSLCITEDGVRPIYSLQWAGVPIPYVISVCNDEYPSSTILHYISGTIVNAKLISECTWLDNSIVLDTIYLKDENCFHTGGYLMSSITIPTTEIPSVSTVIVPIQCNFSGTYDYKTVRIPAQKAKIVVSAEVSYLGNNYSLSGTSNEFTIYPFEEFHSFRRRGESENLAEKLKYYAFTDRMRNFPTLWEYVDSIFGTDLDSLGSRAFFGIDRFVDQHGDIDRCNIRSLLGNAKMMDVNSDDYGLDAPHAVQRILDLASIPLEKIVGTRCVCNTNFQNCENCCGGNVCRQCGFDKRSNVGSPLTMSDYVTAGVPILYKEQSGSVYEIFNVVSQNNQNVYQLHTLSGGPFENTSLTNFCFYKWDNAPQGNPLESEIDYLSEFTTISPNISSMDEWFGDGGVIEEVLNYTILKGLGLHS